MYFKKFLPRLKSILPKIVPYRAIFGQLSYPCPSSKTSTPQNPWHYLSSVGIGSWYLDLGSKELRWSEDVYKVFGLDPTQSNISHPEYISYVHPEDLNKLLSVTQYAILRGDPYQVEHRIVTPSGDVRDVFVTGRVLSDESGLALSVSGTMQDITEYKNSKKQVYYQAYHDTLTGLPNRPAFNDFLELNLKLARQSRLSMVVMFIDLDGFKGVNDTFGHDVGDLLLKTTAERLKSCVRASDLVSRLSGDEFTVILPNIEPDLVDRVSSSIALNIIESLSDPFTLNGNNVSVTSSIGIGVFPRDGDTCTEVVKKADQAMYYTKHKSKNSYSFYSMDIDHEHAKRNNMEKELRAALFLGQFELYLQPQINISTSKVVGAEALIRWNHPERGLVGPNEFIPVAEELGIIDEIGSWVVEEACRIHKSLQDNGLGPIKIMVNVSASHICKGGILGSVERSLTLHGVDPAFLGLELTETSLLNNTVENLKILQDLQNLGVSISIDDFGTGYSSLGYLRKFRLNALKVDKSFIADLDKKESREIVKAIIMLSRGLNYEVIAEGVESLEQVNFLRENGCPNVQGYYFSRPLPVEQLKAYLKDRN